MTGYDVFDALVEPVVCYEVDGTIVYVNAPAAVTLQRPPEDLVAANVWELYPESGAGEFREAFERVARTGASEHVERYYPHRRRTYSSQLFKRGDHVIAVTRDVTDERRATERLRALAKASQVFGEAASDMQTCFEKIARYVAESLGDLCSIRLLSADGARFEAPIGIWDTDPQARALLQGLPHTARDEALAPELRREMRPIVMANVDPREMAARLAPPSHRDRAEQLQIHSAMVAPLRGEGLLLGTLSVCRRRSATEEPYTADDLALLEELADRAALVVCQARTLADLRSAVATRDEFLSIASHELRTPLTTLDLQLDGLQRALERANGDGDRLSRKLEIAMRQSERLAHLVEGLLDVSRLASGRFELELGDFDLVALLRDVVERFEEQAARTGTPIALAAPAAIAGRWDRMRLDQVLTNLMSNAIKYGAGKPIRIAASEATDTVELTFADEGIGISASDVERIFGRFERAVSSTHYGGLGLGLYISRQIVVAHGGTITATGVPGAGAVFTLRLPRWCCA